MKIEGFKHEGRLPSLNEYIAAERANRYKAAAMKKEYQNEIVWDILTSNIDKDKIKTPIRLEYYFFEESPRRDCDNVFSFASKVIQDALVECGIIPDDSPKYINGFNVSFIYGQKDERGNGRNCIYVDIVTDCGLEI